MARAATRAPLGSYEHQREQDQPVACKAAAESQPEGPGILREQEKWVKSTGTLIKRRTWMREDVTDASESRCLKELGFYQRSSQELDQVLAAAHWWTPEECIQISGHKKPFTEHSYPGRGKCCKLSGIT